MKGDITRLTWDRTKHYESVRMQQGRVQVDADWNEHVDIQTHLRQTALADVIGRACAPKGEAGYEISADGGDLQISDGRLYVDGILCEQAEPALAYLAQPDYPGAELPAAAGTVLVYLDVWKRHITALEDPEIREVALGGPDTTTRLKTVCQVKLQGVPAGSDCADVEVDRPAPGSLGARTRPASDPENVCVVPATAGYTRLENYTYRIEVHQGGELGVDSPTFKWSRNNGSVVTDWLAQDAVDPNILRVASTGRDRLLGFHDAAWVELIDDERELRGEPGVLVEVVHVEDDFIEIDPGALTVDISDFTTHPKIRRWDMASGAGEMAIEVPATDDGFIPIEGGVQVHFGAGSYRTGDYWIIPARAFIGEFIGDIEWPVDDATGDPLQQLPRGIEHHYAKLALVDFDGTEFVAGSETDCLHDFPTLCGLETGCCTVVVEPGEDIQAAIDGLPPQGGCICLKSGDHEIDETLRLDRSDVTLHGESPGTRVIGSALPLLVVGGSPPRNARIEIHGIRFESVRAPTSKGIPAVLALGFCDQVAVRACGISAPPARGVIGITLFETDRIVIEGCHIEPAWTGVWVSEDALRLTVHGNRVVAGGARGHTTAPLATEAGYVGVDLQHAFAPCVVTDNDIEGFAVGIALTHDPIKGSSFHGASGSLIEGNQVLRGVTLGGVATDLLYAIDVAADDCRVRDNRISFVPTIHGGIRLTGSRTRVERNVIEVPRGEDPIRSPIGVLVGLESSDGPPTTENRVCHNQIRNVEHGVVVRGGSAVVVGDNVIESPGGRLRSGILLDGVTSAWAGDNRIGGAETAIQLDGGERNTVSGNHIDGGLNGVIATSDNAVELSHNRIRGTGGAAVTLGQWLKPARLQHNRIEACGWRGGTAVFAYSGLGELVVESCDVRETGKSPQDGSVLSPAFGLIGVGVIQASVQSNNFTPALKLEDLVGNAVPDIGRAVVLIGLIDFQVSDRVSLGFPAQLVANRFSGSGRMPIVEIAGFQVNPNFHVRFNRVIFSDNHCWHVTGAQSDAAATVRITAQSASAMGNHFKALTPIASIDFGATRALYMGNVSQQVGAQGSAILPSPQSNFNRT